MGGTGANSLLKHPSRSTLQCMALSQQEGLMIMMYSFMCGRRPPLYKPNSSVLSQHASQVMSSSSGMKTHL